MTVETLSYAIDDEDRLIKVDEGYYRFAAENGWEGAGASLGRSLWDFVAGHEVKKLQRLLLRRGGGGGRGVGDPLRGAGPAGKRGMGGRRAPPNTGLGGGLSARPPSRGGGGGRP